MNVYGLPVLVVSVFHYLLSLPGLPAGVLFVLFLMVV